MFEMLIPIRTKIKNYVDADSHTRQNSRNDCQNDWKIRFFVQLLCLSDLRSFRIECVSNFLFSDLRWRMTSFRCTSVLVWFLIVACCSSTFWLLLQIVATQCMTGPDVCIDPEADFVSTLNFGFLGACVHLSWPELSAVPNIPSRYWRTWPIVPVTFQKGGQSPVRIANKHYRPKTLKLSFSRSVTAKTGGEVER
jgi:hypothetical protein